MRALNPTIRVIHGRSQKVLQHFLVLREQRRIDLYALNVVASRHGDLDHAGTALAYDRKRCEVLLELRDLFLHLACLLHHVAKPGHACSIVRGL